ncbi:hypothetical protein Mgra_00009098 [Meloidogyne graminicola]|uniref:Uncharacterized protein n=1 Tax=Meloidogyne graminicola TaxID=189291 RepID=A0A8S9ZDY2_9BILA|nr:hypothetical protein Mgra_00009098 [Meloidogyne graminicola]
MPQERRSLHSARPFVSTAIHPTNNEDDNAMQQMMCDLILDEIQTQIDRVQKETEQRRQEELRLTKMPDYSWLIDWKLRTKRPLGFRESTEIEYLTTKIRPGEWRGLLEEWRSRVRYAENREEILNIFKQTIEWIINKRMENECKIECINEQEIKPEIIEKKQTKTNIRPMTAQPRISLKELSIFALTNPPSIIGEGNV